MHLLPSLLLLAPLAAAWNPSNSYAPSHVACPADGGSFVRAVGDNGALSAHEQAWVRARHAQTDAALADFLERANMTDFDAAAFLGTNTSLTLALAFSGGGYRAMLAAAGQFAALDARTPNATNAGHLGGLVQAATYFAGLSGGSWLVGSVAVNNFTTVDELRAKPDIWDLQESIFNPGADNATYTREYYERIIGDVRDKQRAGFDTSITDLWGRALSQQLIDAVNGGPAMAWSDIQEYPAFANHSMPLPLLVAVARPPGTTVISTNSTVFEFSPFELGSWDPSLAAFTNMTYLGTNVTAGVPNNETCVVGFDQSGFAMGTSASLFNAFLLEIDSTGISGVLRIFADSLLQTLDEDSNDIAVFSPNPFAHAGDNVYADSTYLALVDGGMDGQNVPLAPLLHPARAVDLVFAFDNSGNTNDTWPNGRSLVATYERQFGAQAGASSVFPSVPDTNTFLNLGLTRKPTFFGCYAANFSDPANAPPLVVYSANAYYTYFSNTSTFKMSYTAAEKNGIIANTYAAATYGNGTVDSEYAACVGCAAVQRERERRGLAPTAQCAGCFARYCWDGSLNATAPADELAINAMSVLEAHNASAYTSNSSENGSGSGGAWSRPSSSASASATTTAAKNGAGRLTGASSVVLFLLAAVLL